MSQPDRRIVLVVGLPGVGKTTLVRSFTSNNPAWVRTSGGDLIQQNLLESERDSLRSHSGDEVYQNQLIILKNFEKLLAKEQRNIVFDGHCLVKTLTGEYYPIPTEIIEGIGPGRIILLDATPATIIARREADTARPNREVETEEEIRQRQQLSVATCQKYAETLGISFLHLVEPTPTAFTAAIV